MASTQYHVIAVDAEGGETEIATKSKKATASDAARAHRQETGEGVLVKTGAGNVVLELKAKKSIKMTPRYQRTVELPEDVEVPDGKRVAYFRPRRHAAVLHDAEAPKDEAYSILDTATGEESDERFPTTRAAGRFLVDA